MDDKDLLDQLPDEKVDPNSEFLSLENEIWNLRSLKKKFADRNLENLFSKYEHRLHREYFSIFILIQICLTVIHIGLLIFCIMDNSRNHILSDIFAYLGIEVIFSVLAIIVFKKKLVEKHPWLPHFVSALVIILIVIVDMILPIYHTALFHSKLSLRPAYSTHALLACYIFFPENNNIIPVILGVTTSFLHLANLYFISYRNSADILKQILADAIFFICINILGIYFRYINEIFIRHTFLDRRTCIESTLKLNYEKEREDQLILSILPRHLASQIREDLRKNVLENQKLKIPDTSLYIQKHNEVSILYADVVNYTKMTSSLPANRLVEILNELFGSFDDASEKHKVLRIKFLGDCYYCVSGLPQSNAHHARNCVELGLEMIKIIKNVRDANNLNIDMRIGIHSGSILCGLLGKCKWQYDIWSKNVIIANHMEQSGKSGMVHITKQTLERLGNQYEVEPGFGHWRDELLAKCNIETFFIIPKNTNRYSCFTSMTQIKAVPPPGIYSSLFWRFSMDEEKSKVKGDSCDSNNEISIQQHGADVMYNLNKIISGDGHLVLSRRREAFMDSDLILNHQQLKMADINMEKAIENLSLGNCGQWFCRESPGSVCLTFKNKDKWKIAFLEQPDPLFKYHLTSSFLVFISISIIEALIFLRWSSISLSFYTCSAFVFICLLFLTWIYFLWNKFCNSSCSRLKPQPKNKILKLFYIISLKVISSALARTILCIIVCMILTLCLLVKFIDLKSDKMNSKMKNGTIKFILVSDYTEFTGSWQVTESCILAIITIFLFFRVYFQLKLIMTSCMAAVYIFCIYNNPLIFEKSGTWNPDMSSTTAHVLCIVFLVIELHLIDRQTEHMSHLDYSWKKQLAEEKEEMTNTKFINRMLLQNILPKHVADIYLNGNKHYLNELYYENYKCVSVMFASLTNYSLYKESDIEEEAAECNSLRILNLIVCNFDDALLLEEYERIEKIKVAGWSYMAACGLAQGSRPSAELSDKCDNQVVLIMTRFATEMMRIIKKINKQYSTNFGLRIGISYGPVTAGVVGSQKPYYDVWGNTVNVASRMDSTGEAGKIQVPRSFAEILEKKGVQCEMRGNIFVKGKGYMTTYYVKLTEHCFLNEKFSHQC